MVRAVVLHRAAARRSSSLSIVTAIGLGLGLGLTAGCGVAQRPSVKMVDPGLAAHGAAMEREPAKGGFMLGSYRVRDTATRSEAVDPDGPLASEDVRRPVTQHHAALELAATATGRTWTSTCTLQRRAPAEADFHAVLDENGDEIAIDCTASTKGLPPWRFRARALLSRNFGGKLWSEADGADDDEADDDGREAAKAAWSVEILTRATYFQRVDRLLSVPVAQLRRDRKAVLAVLLGRPERAWVAKDLDPVTAEAALALLLTLRLMPWELAE